MERSRQKFRLRSRRTQPISPWLLGLALTLLACSLMAADPPSQEKPSAGPPCNLQRLCRGTSVPVSHFDWDCIEENDIEAPPALVANASVCVSCVYNATADTVAWTDPVRCPRGMSSMVPEELR